MDDSSPEVIPNPEISKLCNFNVIFLNIFPLLEKKILGLNSVWSFIEKWEIKFLVFLAQLGKLNVWDFFLFTFLNGEKAYKPFYK